MLLLSNRVRATDTAVAMAVQHKEIAVTELTQGGYLLHLMIEVDKVRDPADFLASLNPVKDLLIPHGDETKNIIVPNEDATALCSKLYGI
jgi:hypothetical protein